MRKGRFPEGDSITSLCLVSLGAQGLITIKDDLEFEKRKD